MRLRLVRLLGGSFSEFFDSLPTNQETIAKIQNYAKKLYGPGTYLTTADGCSLTITHPTGIVEILKTHTVGNLGRDVALSHMLSELEIEVLKIEIREKTRKAEEAGRQAEEAVKERQFLTEEWGTTRKTD